MYIYISSWYQCVIPGQKGLQGEKVEFGLTVRDGSFGVCFLWVGEGEWIECDGRAGLPEVTGDCRDAAPGTTGRIETPDGSDGILAEGITVRVALAGGLCLPTGG